LKDPPSPRCRSSRPAANCGPSKTTLGQCRCGDAGRSSPPRYCRHAEGVDALRAAANYGPLKVNFDNKTVSCMLIKAIRTPHATTLMPMTNEARAKLLAATSSALPHRSIQRTAAATASRLTQAVVGRNFLHAHCRAGTHGQWRRGLSPPQHAAQSPQNG